MRYLVSVLIVFGILLHAAEGNATTAPTKAGAAPVASFENQRDPVYMLELDKYPKFTTEMILKNGKKLRFASVKAMLNYYYHPEKYPGFGAKSRRDIERMYVQDYLDGTKIPLQKAWYVFGSRLAGPHGDDLIPLSSKTRAELFVQRYGGTRIMSFDEVAKKGYGLIRYLDM